MHSRIAQFVVNKERMKGNRQEEKGTALKGGSKINEGKNREKWELGGIGGW